jgi:hypothetical protein
VASYLRWRGRQLEEKCGKALAKGINSALRALWIELRRVVGRQGPPRSRPGQAPRKDTGFGQSQIVLHVETSKRAWWAFWRSNTVVGSIAVTDEAKYMEMLEDGTRRIAPRPWIRVTWNRMLPVMRRLIARDSK